MHIYDDNILSFHYEKKNNEINIYEITSDIFKSTNIFIQHRFINKKYVILNKSFTNLKTIFIYLKNLIHDYEIIDNIFYLDYIDFYDHPSFIKGIYLYRSFKKLSFDNFLIDEIKNYIFYMKSFFTHINYLNNQYIKIKFNIGYNLVKFLKPSKKFFNNDFILYRIFNSNSNFNYTLFNHLSLTSYIDKKNIVILELKDYLLALSLYKIAKSSFLFLQNI